jgi:hypothetical protein
MWKSSESFESVNKGTISAFDTEWFRYETEVARGEEDNGIVFYSMNR